MIARITLVFGLLLLCVTIGGGSFINKLKESSETRPEYVIFDTDMGPDDAWALQILLKAEKKLKTVKVLAITTVDGNTDIENVIKNTYRILDGLNRTDIPIYKGATEAIVPINPKGDPYFGKNGFCDVNVWLPHFPNDINSIIQKKNAPELIRDLVMQNPNKISLICVGPLSNIALAIKAYPEIKENIKGIFIMGGSYSGRGTDIPGAEFNFYIDPEAAHIVLNSLISPIVIAPLEIKDHINISWDWRFNVLGKSNDANVKLLNEAEKVVFRRSYFPFDATLAAAFLFPSEIIQTSNPYHVILELQGLYTRGQMIIDSRNNSYNVLVIEKAHEAEFKNIMIQIAASP